MIKPILLTLALLLGIADCVSAQRGFYMGKGRKRVEIPFEYTNNFIILTVNFQGGLPLKFIFDTGAEHTILSKRQISDLMGIPYEREFRVTGSDLQTELIAYLARHIKLEIPNLVTAPNEDILVLQEDYFRFEEFAGVTVHGILAAQAFSRYIIEIDYSNRVMILYDREHYKPKDGGSAKIPVDIYRNKIYLNTFVEMLPDSVAPVKLLVDTGAGLTLLLFSDTHPLLHPPPAAIPANIGMGLGGYLEGFTGRTDKLMLGPYDQNFPITYFQQPDSVINPELLNGRNGLLGNGILNRFTLTIDYQNEWIKLRPGKRYRDAFVYDRSGLHIIASGPHLNDFSVQNVLIGSPAADVGIQRGDEIIKVGHTPASFFTLSNLLNALQKKPGKKVKLIIRRNGVKMEKVLTLRDII